MNKTEYQPGQLCWVDLSSSDPKKATPFYEGLFGWESLPDADDGRGYTMFLLDGGRVAGMVATHSKATPSAWNPYVRVGSANDVTHGAADRGGKVIMEATDFGRTGQAAYISDREGAAIGAWVPNDHRGATLAAEAGAFHHAELATKDLQQAQEFYDGLFSWDFFPRVESGSVDVVAGGEASFGLRKTDAGEKSEWTIFFAVTDLDDSLKRVKALKGGVRRPAKAGPAGRVALVTDPAGGRFGLIELAD